MMSVWKKIIGEAIHFKSQPKRLSATPSVIAIEPCVGP